MSDSNPSEDPLERARRLLNDKDSDEKKDKKKSSTDSGKPSKSSKKESSGGSLQESLETARQIHADISWVRQQRLRIIGFFTSISVYMHGVWEKSGPVRRVLGPFFSRVGKTSRRFVEWASLRTDPETGERIFSGRRASVIFGSTALLIVILVLAAPFLFTTSKQAVMRLVSQREAYTYINGSETIVEGRLYSVKTNSRVPATPGSTTHMHVKRDIVYGILYPEDLANAVPNEVAWGRIKYTGWRIKLFNWYPEVKDIEAVPLNVLPPSHPAVSGSYSISPAELKEAKRDGVTLPGTNLSEVLADKE